MRYMMIVKAAESAPPPPQELYAAIGQMSRKMAASGILLDDRRPAASAQGARIRLEKGALAITDGPFTEAKELIGGFAIRRPIHGPRPSSSAATSCRSTPTSSARTPR